MNTIKFLNLSWQDIEKLTKKVCLQIKKSSFKPDLIVAVARGGLVPARLVSDYLNIKKILTIQLVFYNKIGKHSIRPKLISALSSSIKNKNVLVVEDIADSGSSLEFVKKYLKSKSPKKLKFLVLHTKPTSSFKPDFFAAKTNAWVVYPWEKQEVKKEKKQLRI